MNVLDTGLVTVEEACAELGVTQKRLLGFIFRNGIADPIGDHRQVYGWSLRTLAARLADTSAAVRE